MDAKLPDIAVAEQLAAPIAALDPGKLPAAMRARCEETLIDVVGLCLAARNEDYVQSAFQACDDDGPCTAIGHNRTLGAAGAALVNGTAAHGEDFDDTFEGGRCTPARSSCRRCWRPASGMAVPARMRSPASRWASR